MPTLEDNRKKTPDVVLTRDLDENVCRIQKEFDGNEMLKMRYVENQSNPGVRCCIFFTDNMVNNTYIHDNIIRPIERMSMPLATHCVLDVLMNKVIEVGEVKKTNDFEDIVEGIVFGDTVLLAAGCADAIVLSTKGWPVRALSEPEGEKVQSGPKEGFCEALLVNLTLLRRRIKTRDLQFQYKSFGLQTKTKVCITYIKGLAKQEVLDELERRLSLVDMDAVLEANYLTEIISDHKVSLFATVGTTERPDIVAAKLLEGRVAIFVDGTPQVITIPYLFIENIQSNEDYYVSFWYASFYRLLRALAFFLAITIPAFYVAAVTVQHELLPTELALSIAVARQGVPFPTFMETLLMLVVFEVLKETGIRMNSSIGQALSIVGALVVGQAAVEAKLVSAPVIIVVAASGIMGLVLPKLSIAVNIIRIILMLLAFVMGIYGIGMGLMGLLLYLVDLRSFGMSSIMKPGVLRKEQKDTFVRGPWWLMKNRPNSLSQDDTRMGRKPVK